MIYTEEVQLKDGVSKPAQSAAEKVRTLETALTSTKKAMTLAAAQHGEMSKQFQALSSKASNLTTALEGAKGETQGLSGIFAQFGGELAEIGPAGIALAVIMAEVAAAAAVAAAAYKGMLLSLEAVEAKEKLVATVGEETFDMLNSLSSQLPQTREQLGKWATTLQTAGVSASQMPDRLKAIASAQALMGASGEEAAQKVQNLFAKISEAQQLGSKLKVNEKMFQGIGVSVSDVAAELGIASNKLQKMIKAGTVDAAKFGDALQAALIKKGGGALKNMAGELGVLKAKLQENVLKLFEDVNVGPFKEALGSVLKLFDQSTASGRAMKMFITKTFDTIFAVAAKVFPYVRGAILGIVIASLKIYIALKPAIRALGELFGGAGGDGTGVIDALSAIGGAVAWLITAITEGVKLISKAWTWMSNEFDIVRDDVTGTVAGIIGAITSLPGEAIGVAKNFIQGLVNGISSGTGMVIDAVRALGQGAMTALKGILGIASPSKEMAKLGKFTAQGFSGGLDQHMPDIETSMKNAGALPDVGGGGKGGGGGRGGVTVNVEAGAIQISGAQNAEALTEQAISLLFERIALTQGLGSAA